MEKFKLPPLKHQLECLNKHGRSEFFALLAEQGTGKTYIIINNIADLWSSRDLDAAMIFAPNGVHTNWTRRELPKTMPDWVRYNAVAWQASMNKKELARLESLYSGGDSTELRVFTMNWEALATKRGFEAAKRFCMSCNKLMIVADESHRVKNPSAAVTKALMKLRALSSWRRIMSGTSIANAPFDAFSQFTFLDDHIMETSSYYAFKAEYAELLNERSGLIRKIVGKKVAMRPEEKAFIEERIWKIKTMVLANGREELKELLWPVIDAFDAEAYDNIIDRVEALKGALSPAPSPRKTALLQEMTALNSKLATYQRKVANAFAPNRLPQIVQRDDKGRPKYRNLDKLNKLIAPHSFRVLKKDCLDLPDKIYKTAFFDMTPEQRRIYDKAAEEGRLTLDGEDTPFNRLVIFGKLAQITSGYYLHPDASEPVRIEGGSPKIDLLIDRVSAALEEDRKVIIWARYHVEIDDVCAALRACGLEPATDYVEYHGRVKKKDRDAAIDTFEEGSARVFVGQQQAGGVGITLIAASEVIYFSNTFSLVDREQSEDRAHRIGQTKGVVYTNLLAEGTIDEQIVDVLQNKKTVAEIVLAFPKN